MRLPRHLLALMFTVFSAALLCGVGSCTEDEDNKDDQPLHQPSAPIPAADPLGSWQNLKLGMTQLELSQIYNAPEGRGEGFMRTIEMFGDVTHHTVLFDERITLTGDAGTDPAAAKVEGSTDANPDAETATDEPTEVLPQRKLILSFYRDKLYSIVDRREGFTAAQRDAWFGEMKQQFGEQFETILPTSNWRWGSEDSLRADFVQDNASADYMSGRLWVAHMPTYNASLEYLDLWMTEHPEQFAAPK